MPVTSAVVVRYSVAYSRATGFIFVSVAFAFATGAVAVEVVARAARSIAIAVFIGETSFLFLGMKKAPGLGACIYWVVMI